jgi:hypothetical protein
MDLYDPDKLKLPVFMIGQAKGTNRLPRHKPGGRFLKGPIPWDWLSVAARLPGKALHVATALWFAAGIKNTRVVALSGKVLRDMGVQRNAGYRGLDALEGAGLVSVDRHSGRCPLVTMHDAPAS